MKVKHGYKISAVMANSTELFWGRWLVASVM